MPHQCNLKTLCSLAVCKQRHEMNTLEIANFWLSDVIQAARWLLAIVSHTSTCTFSLHWCVHAVEVAQSVYMCSVCGHSMPLLSAYITEISRTSISTKKKYKWNKCAWNFTADKSSVNDWTHTYTLTQMTHIIEFVSILFALARGLKLTLDKSAHMLTSEFPSRNDKANN